MGIIKHLKQLGRQTHGAKYADIVIFDKDGNVRGGNRNINTYLPAISVSTRGKFLRVKTNDNSAEWVDISQVPAFTQDDDGKVLTATDQGAAWAFPYEDVTDQFTVSSDFNVNLFKAIKFDSFIFITGNFVNSTESAVANPDILTFSNTLIDKGQIISAYPGNIASLLTSGSLRITGTVNTGNSCYISGVFSVK